MAWCQVRRTSLGDVISVVPTSAGRYVALLPQPPADAFFDLRIDCAIGTAAQGHSIRVPVAKALPARLVVRPYPTEFLRTSRWRRCRPSSRTPWAIDCRRTASCCARIAASSRSIRRSPPLFAANTAATRPRPREKDTLRASWSIPAGNGPRWASISGCIATSESVEVYGRAIDVLGTTARRSGARAHGRGPDRDGGDERVRAAGGARSRTGNRSRRGRSPWRAGHSCARRSSSPARASVAIPRTRISRRSSRFRLSSGASARSRWERSQDTISPGGETARIQVRLTDCSGNAVTDETIELRASDGSVTEPEPKPDGTYEATFAPPPGFTQGTIRITVTGKSSAIETSTEIEVAPREVSFAPGVHAGYLISPPNLYAPFVGLQSDNKLGRQSSFPLFLRADARLSSPRPTWRTSTPIPQRAVRSGGGQSALPPRFGPPHGAWSRGPAIAATAPRRRTWTTNT